MNMNLRVLDAGCGVLVAAVLLSSAAAVALNGARTTERLRAERQQVARQNAELLKSLGKDPRFVVPNRKNLWLQGRVGFEHLQRVQERVKDISHDANVKKSHNRRNKNASP